MRPIKIFRDRLLNIGIEINFIGNYPWIYLDTINGIKVKGAFLGDHGFTAFWSPIKLGESTKITDISEVFKKIRETLCRNINN